MQRAFFNLPRSPRQHQILIITHTSVEGVRVKSAQYGETGSVVSEEKVGPTKGSHASIGSLSRVCKQGQEMSF